MLYFWLFAGVLIFLVVTFKGFQDDFKVWGYYYLFSGLSFLMFFTRRYMMRRMVKHLQYMEEQEKKEKENQPS